MGGLHRSDTEESHGRGWNTPFHPDDKQPAWNARNHAVQSGDAYRVECRLRGAGGVYHWFLTRGVPLRDGAGNIVKWFGTCTDIDELKGARTGNAPGKPRSPNHPPLRRSSSSSHGEVSTPERHLRNVGK